MPLPEPTQSTLDCDCEHEVEMRKANAEALVMTVVGIGVAATPIGLIAISYHAAMNHIDLKIEPQLLQYSLVSAGVVVSYLFGKSLLKKFTGGKE